MAVMVSVIFIHGVGGPVPGWDGALRAGLRNHFESTAASNAEAQTFHTVTLRYDDVFSGVHRASQRTGPGVRLPTACGRTEEQERYRLRRLQLVELVAEAAAAADGTDGAGRLRPPKLVPSAAVVRWPFSGMSHAMAYRRDLEVRDIVRSRVAHGISEQPGPRIVIAHSLGSVVALDALHVHDVPVDLLVTIGSPLGIDRGWGRPWEGGSSFPHGAVGSWLNVVNTRDPIPWSRGVQERYPDAVDAFITAGARPVGPGGAHDPATYVSSGVVLSSVAAALTGYADPLAEQFRTGERFS